MTVVEFPTPDPRSFDNEVRPFAEAVASHYAVKRLIGKGGMGVVYLARDRRLDRLVAIKTLPPHLANDASVRERFLREIRMASAMSHPNIVPIHGADEIDGHVFFVMGYVDGESLAARVRAHGRLDAAQVVTYLRDVASALSHAHKRGTIHRDIKAENILVERSTGRAVLTDFGIARVAEAQPLTATGQLLGTVYYASPEQVSGEPVDGRSDLYSLGVVGFLALTGRFPFDGEAASAVLVSHVTKPAPRVAAVNPDVPEAIAGIIDRCLQKQPGGRFADADEFVAALDSALDKPSELLTETRAQAIWSRAAELQAITRANGAISLNTVRAAAAEAGIDPEYVDRALLERNSRRPASGELSPSFAGIPLEVHSELVIQHTLAARDTESVLNALRDATGELGTTVARETSIYWRFGRWGSRGDVSVTPENQATRIHVTQSLRRTIGATVLTSAVIGALLGVTVAAAVHFLMDIPAPSWSFRLSHLTVKVVSTAAGVGVAVLAVPVWRAIARKLALLESDGVRSIADAVAARLRTSIPQERLR